MHAAVGRTVTEGGGGRGAFSPLIGCSADGGSLKGYGGDLMMGGMGKGAHGSGHASFFAPPHRPPVPPPPPPPLSCWLPPPFYGAAAAHHAAAAAAATFYRQQQQHYPYQHQQASPIQPPTLPWHHGRSIFDYCVKRHPTSASALASLEHDRAAAAAAAAFATKYAGAVTSSSMLRNQSNEDEAGSVQAAVAGSTTLSPVLPLDGAAIFGHTSLHHTQS